MDEPLVYIIYIYVHIPIKCSIYYVWVGFTCHEIAFTFVITLIDFFPWQLTINVVIWIRAKENMSIKVLQTGDRIIQHSINVKVGRPSYRCFGKAIMHPWCLCEIIIKCDFKFFVFCLKVMQGLNFWFLNAYKWKLNFCMASFYITVFPYVRPKGIIF